MNERENEWVKEGEQNSIQCHLVDNFLSINQYVYLFIYSYITRMKTKSAKSDTGDRPDNVVKRTQKQLQIVEKLSVKRLRVPEQ